MTLFAIRRCNPPPFTPPPHQKKRNIHKSVDGFVSIVQIQNPIILTILGIFVFFLGNLFSPCLLFVYITWSEVCK